VFVLVSLWRPCEVLRSAPQSLRTGPQRGAASCGALMRFTAEQSRVRECTSAAAQSD